jgi:spermidine synthase
MSRADIANAPPSASLILVVAGASLGLAQFAALREYAALLGSNELVALLVLCAYFLGLSIGYHVSGRLSRRALIWLGGLTLALNATLPFSVRWFAGAMSAMRFEGTIPPAIFLLVLCGITPFYAVFLPRLIDEAQRDEPDSRPLVRCYAAELAGACLGLVLVILVTPARMGILLSLHLAGVVTLLVLYARPPRRAVFGLYALLPLYAVAYPPLDRISLARLYEQCHRSYENVRILASEFSPYQRVDIVRADTPGRLGVTYLYLNGNLLYGSRVLHQHNLFVALLPNFLSPAGTTRACVIAGGSLDNARHLAGHARSLEVVEVDEAVVRLTRKHLQEPLGGFPTNWRLTIDDGKHFLGAWRGDPFDVISVDVPIPTHLQTAMLHSQRFFALARSRLSPGGIFSIALAGKIQPLPAGRTRLANRVLAGLLATFPHVTVVRSGERDFAWAGSAPFPLDAATVQQRMDSSLDLDFKLREDVGEPRLRFVDPAEVRALTAGCEPIGEADMKLVLKLSLSKLYYRYYDPD